MGIARASCLTIFAAPELPEHVLERARAWRVIPHADPLPEREVLRSWLLRGGALFLGYRADEAAFEERFEALSERWGGRLPKAWVAALPGPVPDLLWQKWVWRGLWLFTADVTQVLDGLEAS